MRNSAWINSTLPRPRVDFKKFDHFNGLHIRNLDPDELARRLQPFFEAAGYRVDTEVLNQVAPLVQERVVTLDDALDMAGFFFKDEVEPDPEQLVAKNLTAAASAEVARQAYAILSELPEFSHAAAEEPLRALAEQLGIKAGQLFSILRMAVTGQTVSPPLFESMAVIGRTQVMRRIAWAIELLEQLADD